MLPVEVQDFPDAIPEISTSNLQRCYREKNINKLIIQTKEI